MIAWLGSLWALIEPMMPRMLTGTKDTLYMTGLATFYAYLLGLPLGVLLVISRRDHIMPSRTLSFLLGGVINILRSVPFLILMVAVIPLTRAVMGTSIGTRATVMPLVIAAFPFVARTVESSLLEVDFGVIQAAQAMGSTNFQIVRKVMLREAFPSLVNGAAIATTNILGYSAMAGAIGGGGLGAWAITHGYQRYNTLVLWIAVVVLMLLVQGIQYIGTAVSRWVDHRLR